MTKENDLARVEDALSTLLDAIAKHDATKPETARPQIRTLASFLPTSEEDDDVDDLLSPDPVGMALRHAVRKLGARVATLTGGTEGMLAVCDRVADRDPVNADWRSMLMDKWWDGLGVGEDRWFC